MSTELTILNQTSSVQNVQQGGLGMDFSSKLFQLKPATININQATTQVEGAIKGKLRISETGDQYDEMFVTLLVMPREQRSYYVGEPGQLNRTNDNLLCFSKDMLKPDLKAKEPQAYTCGSCSKGSWDKYRQDKRKENIPPCDAYYYALFVDTVFKMPLQMYIRSKSKAPFEQGMQNVARTIAKLKSQGKNPNIFDVKFRLSTRKIMTGNNPSYVLDISNCTPIAPEDREEFGEMYLQFADRTKRLDQQDLEASADLQIQQVSNSIDSQVNERSGYTGEIII